MYKLRTFYKEYFYLKKQLILLIILILISTLLSCLSPYIFGVLIDLITYKDTYLMIRVLVIYILLNLLTSILGQIQNLIRNTTIEKLCNNIKIKLFNKITYFKFESRDKYNTGELVNHIEGDCTQIINYYFDLFTNLIIIVANISIAICFLLRLSIENTVIVLANITLVLIINAVNKKRLKNIKNRLNELGDNYNNFVHESIHNNKYIKSFLLEKKEFLMFKKYKETEYSILKENFFFQEKVNFIKNLGFNIGNFMMLLFFALFIASGKLTIGSMVSFNSYMTRLYSAISQILSLNIMSVSVKLSMERIYQITNEKCEEISDVVNFSKLQNINKLEIKNLTFSYPKEKDKIILNKISFEINRPGLYCIVGSNGCGKSSMLKLVMGLYTCTRNQILINNNDIQDITIFELRNNIVYLTNDVYIINDTIENNILIANPNCNHQEIINACKDVGLHDDIIKFEKQYNTIIGVNGVSLSNGQWQKLNFARALIKKGSLFLFDEIDSDLDGKADAKLIMNIKQIAINNIVILITHRVTSLKYAKEIYVMDKGDIKNSGSHQYLLHNSQEYRRLFG